MAEQIFIVEDGTLTKFECDDYVEAVYIPDCVKKIGCRAFFETPVGKVVIPDGVIAIEAWAIGYREDQFHPWLDPIPFGRPVIIYGKTGSEAERYTKDNDWCFNEHITEFRDIKTDTGKQEGE